MSSRSRKARERFPVQNADDLEHHECDGFRWELRDARGIFCCYVCEKCEAVKRAQYRDDIFEDSQYWSDEAIDE
ncbi:hypothetical protein AB3X94_37385 [Paraburkholderia sp. BR10923]